MTRCRNARPEAGRLSVLFYNCHLFGSGGSARLMSALRKLRDGRPLIYREQERAELIARHVCELAVRRAVDVVAFCEIWDDKLATLIRHRAASTFPYSYRPSKCQSSNRGGDVYGSGLLLLSRLPLRRIGRTLFDAESGDDAFSQKAFARVIVNCPNGPSIVVAWTHLQAGESGSDREARNAQIDQLAQTLARSQKRGTFCTLPVVLLGDLNIPAEDGAGRPAREYLEMITTLRMSDAYRLVHPDASAFAGYTSDSSRNHLLQLFHGPESRRRRIDYVLFAGLSDERRLLECEIEDFTTNQLEAGVGHLSDHSAVRAVFEV